MLVPEIAEAALLELQSIDRGETPLIVSGPNWDQAWCGDVTFVTPNGWTFVVFNDCDEWDYLDTVTSPAGESLDYDQINESRTDLVDWRPKNEDIWRSAK